MPPNTFTSWRAVAKTVNECTKLVMDGEALVEVEEDDEASDDDEGSGEEGGSRRGA